MLPGYSSAPRDRASRFNSVIRTHASLYALNSTFPSLYVVLLWPREYPMRFARHLARESEALKQGCEAKLKVPQEYPSALKTFAAMTYGVNAELWQFANLRDVFVYLRGGKQLHVPRDWEPLVPRTFPGSSRTD